MTINVKYDQIFDELLLYPCKGPVPPARKGHRELGASSFLFFFAVWRSLSRYDVLCRGMTFLSALLRTVMHCYARSFHFALEILNCPKLLARKTFENHFAQWCSVTLDDADITRVFRALTFIDVHWRSLTFIDAEW